METRSSGIQSGASPVRSTEGGFALAAAIFALVVVGALVTGGFFAASQEGRIGESSLIGSEAFYMAERGLADVIGTRTVSYYNAIPVYGSAMVGPVEVYKSGNAVGSYAVEVHRMADRIYFLRSVGQSLRGGAVHQGTTRRVGLVARTMNLNVPEDRALQVYGSLSVGGNSMVTGQDDHLSVWEDCENVGTVAGVVAKEDSLITTFGEGEIHGDPPVHEDSDMSADDFLQFGDFSFDDLKLMAEKTYPVGAPTINNTLPEVTPNGACDKEVQDNWGAPTDSSHVCHEYLPIIYAEGDLQIASASNGQGILLVEGDLHLSGGYQFFGIVIVKGVFKTTGTGGHVNGLAMVYGGGELDTESISRGNSIVNFSSCAIKRAKELNDWTARAIPLALRSWMDLSAAGVTS